MTPRKAATRVILGISIAVLFLFPFHNSSNVAISLDTAKSTSLTNSDQKDPSLNRQKEKSRLCKEMYPVVCKKRGMSRDPTGTVRPDIEGEKIALETYQNLILLHPEWSSDAIDREFIQQVYHQKTRNRLESAYRWVQSTLIKIIQHQSASVFTLQEKQQLIDRLLKTRLDLPSLESPYSDEPDLLTKSDVFYESLANHQMRLRIGGAYPLSVKSWFNLVFTMAHELAHSIDPCEIRYAQLSYPAYDRLGACFLRHELIAARRTRSECGRQDQLSETFADWMAVQVSATALEQFATEFEGPQLLSAIVNSVRDLCDEDNPYEEDLEFHPSAQVRINQIFGKNPQIRKILGCDPVNETNPNQPEDYCTL